MGDESLKKPVILRHDYFCDSCNYREEGVDSSDPDDDTPIGWIHLTYKDEDSDGNYAITQHHKHFCSKDCLTAWLSGERELRYRHMITETPKKEESL